MIILPALLAAVTLRANAFTQAPSPTLDALTVEAEKDPSRAASTEGARTQASQGFTGETGGPQADAPVKKTEKDPGGSYIMVGQSPMKGINIYTPKPDPNGTGSTDKPKPKDLVSKKMIYGAGGLGAAGIIGGALLGGLFGGLLLVLGGALLGAAAVLWFVNRKATKGK